MYKISKNIPSLDSIHSVVCIEQLEKVLSENYDIEKPFQCELHLRGINDTYRLTSAVNKKFALRLCRHNWRSDINLDNEIALLEFLDNADLSTPKPIKTNNNNKYIKIIAPEGMRNAVLFTWLDGFNLKLYPSLLDAKSLGLQISKFHSISKGFRFKQPNHLEILGDLKYFSPLLYKILSPYESELNFISETIVKICSILPSINDDLNWGVCHGDIHPGNFIASSSSSIGIIDFDVCGEWYQCFDVASFLWSIQLFNLDIKHNECFIDGYESYRKLTQAEKKYLPFFKLVRDAWHLVTWARNQNALGCTWFHDEYIFKRIGFFKYLTKEAFIGI